jgi:hypothetical protein
MRDPLGSQQAGGGLESGPVPTGLSRQAALRISIHLPRQTHQALGASWISELGRSNGLLRPGEGIDELVGFMAGSPSAAVCCSFFSP